MRNDSKHKKDLSELTEDERKQMVDYISKMMVKVHRDLLKEMIYDLFTPSWIKWLRKYKNKKS